jgi:hypothetical protein
VGKVGHLSNHEDWELSSCSSKLAVLDNAACEDDKFDIDIYGNGNNSKESGPDSTTRIATSANSAQCQLLLGQLQPRKTITST